VRHFAFLFPAKCFWRRCTVCFTDSSYARLLAKHDEEEASHVASAVLALLALVTSVIVLLGVLTALTWLRSLVSKANV